MNGKKIVRTMTIIMDAEDDTSIRILDDNIGGDPMFGRNRIAFLKKVLKYCENYSKELEERKVPPQAWEHE